MAPSLATEVRLLEEAYAKLHKMHGELLATLTLPRNRERLRSGNPEPIEFLFKLVDKARPDFESMPGPQSAES